MWQLFIFNGNSPQSRGNKSFKSMGRVYQIKKLSYSKGESQQGDINCHLLVGLEKLPISHPKMLIPEYMKNMKDSVWKKRT